MYWFGLKISQLENDKKQKYFIIFHFVNSLQYFFALSHPPAKKDVTMRLLYQITLAEKKAKSKLFPNGLFVKRFSQNCNFEVALKSCIRSSRG